MAGKFNSGDWVKCPGDYKKVLWLYGYVLRVEVHSIGEQVLVDRGYLGSKWFGANELAPAFEAQSPEDVKQLRDALRKMGGEKWQNC